MLVSAATLALVPATTLLPGCGGSDDTAPADMPTPPETPAVPDPRNVSPDRTMTIDIANHTGQTLTFGSAVGLDGATPPDALPPTIKTGEQSTVLASSSHTDCNGTFRMSGASAGFDFHYVHPHGPGATTVTVASADGYLAATNQQQYAGHNAVAHANLYQGVRNANGQLVAPLGLLETPAWNNAQDFVNSLFATGVRGTGAIQAAVGSSDPLSGLAPIADFTGGQMPSFCRLWARHWLGLDTGTLPPTDAKLLDLLRQYVDTACSAGTLELWVPQFQHLGSSSPAVYGLSSYKPYTFHATDGQWNTDTVATFLALLAGGAHFVAICAKADLPDGVNVQPFDRFLANSSVPTRYDIGSSHYAGVVNTTGHYYLNISGNFAPENCGMLLALLNGRTVNDATLGAGHYNSFIQLEGWQAGAARHNADYNLHTQTLWNISTFGACPYSEKRGTAVFLAPQGWTPQVYQTTCMMPYLGAYATASQQPQAWLRRDLVSVPEDAPALPSRYIAS